MGSNSTELNAGLARNRDRVDALMAASVLARLTWSTLVRQTWSTSRAESEVGLHSLGTLRGFTRRTFHQSSKSASRCSRVPMEDDLTAFRSAFRYGRVSFLSSSTAATFLIAGRL